LIKKKFRKYLNDSTPIERKQKIISAQKMPSSIVKHNVFLSKKTINKKFKNKKVKLKAMLKLL